MTPKPVLITRPEGRADSLIDDLRKYGLEAVHSPILEFRYESDTDIRDAVRGLAEGHFDYLVLTSVTTVDAITALPEWDAVRAAVNSEAASFRTAAVGDVTAEAARDAGLSVELVAQGSARSLAQVFPPVAGTEGDAPRVLYPVNVAAPANLETALRQAGYDVQRETAYRPRTVPQPREVVDGLASGAFSAVVATSPMIMRAVAQLAIHHETKIVVIGNPTYEAAVTANIPVTAVAQAPSGASLAEAVASALGIDA